MTESLPAHILELVADAALKSFWRRRALHDFLRRNGIAENFLATWTKEESKRDLLHRLFPRLEKNPNGPSTIKQIANNLIEQTSFPDLEGWEDSAEKKKSARDAVTALQAYVSKRNESIEDAKSQSDARKRAAEMRAEKVRQRNDLDKLSLRLNELAGRVGDQDAGYEFQDWFFDLVTYFEIVARRPYITDGRQIDGSVTIDGTTYLLEMKFTREQADAPDIDVFFKKVYEKADNTMGLMVSMSGYSSVAIAEASKSRTPLLLIDYNHIYVILHNAMGLAEMVNRLRRHCSQTGKAHLHPQDF